LPKGCQTKKVESVFEDVKNTDIKNADTKVEENESEDDFLSDLF
jgi:hypothetical protein